MFLDLNRFVNKTSKPMNVLYDHRDPLSALNIQVANQVPVFQGMVDMEKASIPLRSPQLLTLSALYDANSELLGSPIEHPDSKLFQDKVKRAIVYWTEVAKAIPDWQKVKDRELAAPALRQDKICTHAIILRALGGVGNALFAYHPNDWGRKIQGLSKLDWRKSIDGRVNPLWDNVCIVAGSVVSHRQARVATLAVLKDALGLPLSNQERVVFSNLPRGAGSNGARPAKAVATIDPVP
jgi:DNA sulfur modification protein DndB